MTALPYAGRPSEARRRGSIGDLVTRAISIYRGWGTTPAEPEAHTWECQAYVPEPHETFFRAVSVQAPKEIVWRWMCQLRVAPYSYDWLDNAGRTSARVLTPGADLISIGQRILIIFRVVEFAAGEQITMRVAGRWRWMWGDVTCTYKVVEDGDDASRLFLALTAHSIPSRFMGVTRLYHVRRFFFPWGELLMVRKQLLTLAALSERQARELQTAGV